MYGRGSQLNTLATFMCLDYGSQPRWATPDRQISIDPGTLQRSAELSSSGSQDLQVEVVGFQINGCSANEPAHRGSVAGRVLLCALQTLQRGQSSRVRIGCAGAGLNTQKKGVGGATRNGGPLHRGRAGPCKSRTVSGISPRLYLEQPNNSMLE